MYYRILILMLVLSFRCFAKTSCKNSISCLMKSKINRMNSCYQRVLKHTKRKLPLNVGIKFDLKRNGNPTNFHFHVSEYHKAVIKGMFTKCLQNAIDINIPKRKYSSTMKIYRSFYFRSRS